MPKAPRAVDVGAQPKAPYIVPKTAVNANVSSLPTKFEENPKHVKTGTYPLLDGAELEFVSKAIASTPEEFRELWNKSKDEKATVPNPWNKKFLIKRKQATYGAEYKFGNQTSKSLGPIEKAPMLVRKCLKDAKERAGSNQDLYTGVHMNFYEGPNAWLKSHQDTELQGKLEGLPIFSYTFIEGGQKPYRYFVVSKDEDANDKKACLALRNGDLVVMKGKQFQKQLWHGVPKCVLKTNFQKPSLFKSQKRINVTVRAWEDAKVVSDQK